MSRVCPHVSPYRVKWKAIDVCGLHWSACKPQTYMRRALKGKSLIHIPETHSRVLESVELSTSHATDLLGFLLPA